MHRSVGDFFGVREERFSYIEHLALYFIANDVKERTRRAHHLFVLLRSVYLRAHIHSLVDLCKPSEVSYKDIVGKGSQSEALTDCAKVQVQLQITEPWGILACYAAE